MSHHQTFLFAVAALAVLTPQLRADEKRYDVVVYGGTSGGVVAATSAARSGRSVVLIEPGKRLGGLTSSGLGATDYGHPESIGGISREFYQRVKAHYQDPRAWKYEERDEYRSHGHDPEDDVMWFFEPHVAERIFADMLREAGVTVVFGERLNRATGVHKSRPRINSITTESGRNFAGASSSTRRTKAT